MPNLLRFSLLGGVVFFCAMAIAHFFGIKTPPFFVYWDTPFYAYQDKIISFGIVSTAALFYVASRQIEIVPFVLGSFGLTVLGLISLNMSDAIAEILPDGASLWPYWLQIAPIAGYWVLLMVLYIRRPKA